MKHLVPSFMLLFTVGCTPAAGPVLATPTGEVITVGEVATDAQGRCFARQAGPTRTEIVTELIEVMPAVKDQNGIVTSPAIFRNVTRPKTVRVGEGAQFETVCPQVYTPEFVATLQRALIVRRAYNGAVTGVLDAGTTVAIQQFQRGMGIDSPLLAVRVATDLGIVAVAR